MFILTGLLALAETSLVRTSKPKALALNESKRRGSKALLRLVEKPSAFLHPILLSVFLCQTVAATLFGIFLSHFFGGFMIFVFTTVEVLVVFVAAEAIPKNWAVHNPVRAALLTAPFVEVIVKFPPLEWLAESLTFLSDRIIPRKNERDSGIVEQELLAMADVAAEEEAIETSERELIHSIIEFGDTVVREVMMPRPEMIAVDGREEVSKALDVAMSAGYSRIPIYRGTLDDIEGIVVAKDLVALEREGKGDQNVSQFLREAHFVPETKKVANLLKEMQKDSFHLAIVVDEYGGTAGVVTLEDLIEELVGEIVDEYDKEEPTVTDLGNGTLQVNARMTVDEAIEVLHLEIPVGDFDTLGGFVLNEMGHVPKKGESIKVGQFKITADSFSGRRIATLLIEPVSKA